MTYKLEFEVRDNEIDIQGVVNNANYPIYFAHARHQYMKGQGVCFAAMAEQKQNLFLLSSFIEFKQPLVSEDKFYVTCKLVPEGKIRFAFAQEIYRSSDNVLIAKAHNVCVCIDGNNRNRPYLPEIVKQLLAQDEQIANH